jgi:hypothetical protein
VSALDDAVGFVRAALADGERPAAEVTALAATQGISGATLRRAVKQAGVVKRKVGQPGHPQRWLWSLSGDAPGGVDVSDPGDAQLRAGEIMAGLVLENGKTWGSCAAPVQVADAKAVLASDPPARRFWIGRGRGYSKTSDAGAMTIAAVLGGVVEPGSRGGFCAADKDQARLAADAIAGWARRSDLGGLVVVEQNRVRFPRHDVDIEIMSSDAPSAWGRRADWWVVDELAAWADAPNARAFYEAVSTSWPKVPTCRVIIITTAGSPAHFSHGIYQAAKADARWRVSDTHEVAPWMDPAEIESEQRRLSAASFSRLWRNEWVEAEDHLVTSANLARCVTLDVWPLPPTANARYVIGVDIGVKNDATAIAVGHVAHRDGERRLVLDALDVFQPTRGEQVPLAKVEERVEQLARRRYRGALVKFDPSQALSMVQALKARGVRVEENPITARWNDSMATLLHSLLRDGLVDLPDEPALLDELKSVRVVETAQGLLSIDSAPGRHDDQVDAIGIVAVELMQRSASTKPAGGGWSEEPPVRRPDPSERFLAGYNPLTESEWGRAAFRRSSW